MENSNIKIKPVVSEKSYALANQFNKYTFLVPRGVNKIELKKVVEKQFKVKVIDTNSVVKPGKSKRDYKTYRVSRKSDMVKVIVTLKQGDKIDEFLKN